ASLAGVSAIGAGIADSAELDLASGGESNPKFGMSLAMLIENACKPGAGRGAPPLFIHYTTRRLISSQSLRHKPAPERRIPCVIPDRSEGGHKSPLRPSGRRGKGPSRSDGRVRWVSASVLETLSAPRGGEGVKGGRGSVIAGPELPPSGRGAT